MPYISQRTVLWTGLQFFLRRDFGKKPRKSRISRKKWIFSMERKRKKQNWADFSQLLRYKFLRDEKIFLWNIGRSRLDQCSIGQLWDRRIVRYARRLVLCPKFRWRPHRSISDDCRKWHLPFRRLLSRSRWRKKVGHMEKTYSFAFSLQLETEFNQSIWLIDRSASALTRSGILRQNSTTRQRVATSGWDRFPQSSHKWHFDVYRRTQNGHQTRQIILFNGRHVKSSSKILRLRRHLNRPNSNRFQSKGRPKFVTCYPPKRNTSTTLIRVWMWRSTH